MQLLNPQNFQNYHFEIKNHSTRICMQNIMLKIKYFVLDAIFFYSSSVFIHVIFVMQIKRLKEILHLIGI
jgi:hypothetical protein